MATMSGIHTLWQADVFDNTKILLKVISKRNLSFLGAMWFNYMVAPPIQPLAGADIIKPEIRTTFVQSISSRPYQIVIKANSTSSLAI